MQKIINFIKERESQNPERYAIVYTIASTVCHATTQAIFKWAHLPVFQALADRGLWTIMILYLNNSQEDYYPKAEQWIIIIFAFLTAFASGVYFYSLNFIALTEATIIFQTNTIWAQVVVLFIHKNQSFSMQKVLNTLISFIGIIFIARPKLDLESAGFTHLFGCILALIAALVASVGFTVLKLVGGKVSSEITTVYFHFFMMTMCSIMQLYTQKYSFTIGYYVSVIFCVVSSMCGHILQFRSLQMVSYSKLANYTYSQVLVSLLIDFFIFGMIPPFFSFLGGGLILFSIFRQIGQNQ